MNNLKRILVDNRVVNRIKVLLFSELNFFAKF